MGAGVGREAPLWGGLWVSFSVLQAAGTSGPPGACVRGTQRGATHREQVRPGAMKGPGL
jgi:hypothetical protein